MNKVEHWYDNEYDEWERLERHKIEFDITKRYLDKYIIGENLEVANEKSREKNVTLEAYIHGNALELEQYEQKYDVILLMGPLYHLIQESDRKAAVKGALRLLKPNGIIVASFISNYAPIQDYLKSVYPIESVDELLGFLKDGRNTGESGFTTAYFTDYKDAKDLMNNFGLTEIVFASVENILSSKENEINMLEEREYRKWLEIGYQLSRDENLIGTSEHFLYIGRK